MDFNFLNRLETIHILVAGEVGIDEYLWGDTRRISPEAPVPVVEVNSQNVKLGLSANVAHNVVALGGKTSLIGIRGDDEEGDRLKTLIAQAGIGESVLITDVSRPTLRKVRVIAQKQHVVRVDYEKSHPLDSRVADEFTECIRNRLNTCDAVIVEDYGKGVWTTQTMGFVKEACRLGKPVFVDPSRYSPLSKYKDVTLLTPNVAEAEALCGFHFASKTLGKDDEKLKKMATHLIEMTGSQHAVITCGEWGMVSVSKDSPELTRIPTFAREVYDVTGAGDTVIAVLALMKCLGFPLNQCMQIANAAAGIIVGRMGAATVTREELKEELERLHKLGFINP